MSKHNLVILGAGTFSQELTDIVNDGGYYNILAYVVDKDGGIHNLNGLPVLDINYLKDAGNVELICGTVILGRIEFIEKAKEYNKHFAIVIHHTANISETVNIECGTVINRGVIISSHTNIGQHVVINRGVNIGHNITIKDYVVIGPGVNIAGGVFVGCGARIGIGATILENITIGDYVIIGAGAVVTKNVPSGNKVMGIPAK